MIESMKAFEIAMAASMEKHERGTCQIAWREGIAHGRKQALEEAAAICNASVQPCNTDRGNDYNRAALDCEKKIRGLLT